MYRFVLLTPALFLALAMACRTGKIDTGEGDSGAATPDTAEEECGVYPEGGIPVDSSCTYVPPTGAIQMQHAPRAVRRIIQKHPFVLPPC